MPQIRIFKVEIIGYLGNAEAAEEEAGPAMLAETTPLYVNKLKTLYADWQSKGFSQHVPDFLEDFTLPPIESLAMLEQKQPPSEGTASEMHSWSWEPWRSGKQHYKGVNIGEPQEFHIWYELVITPILVHH